MTAYTTLTDLDFAAGEAITTSKMKALNNNATAITEGSTGAPQIQTAALADGAVTDVKLEKPMICEFDTWTGGTTGSTTYALLDTYTFTLDYTSAIQITANFDAYLTDGGSAGDMKLVFEGTDLASTVVTETSASGNNLSTFMSGVKTGATAGSKTIQLYGAVDAGTLNVSNYKIMVIGKSL